jgi:hypothetical protein
MEWKSKAYSLLITLALSKFQNWGFDAVNGRKSSSYLGLGIKEGN